MCTGGAARRGAWWGAAHTVKATAAAVGPWAVCEAWGGEGRAPPTAAAAVRFAKGLAGRRGDKLGWGHAQILDKARAKAYKREPHQTRQK